MSIEHVQSQQLQSVGLVNNEVTTPISELPSYLKKWITIQEEISSLNNELKQRRTTSKALKEIILRIMESNKVAKLNISKGTILHHVQDSSEKISTNYILKHCKDFFSGDEEKAKELVKYLEDHRTVVKKHDLKIHLMRPDEDKLSNRS